MAGPSASRSARRAAFPSTASAASPSPSTRSSGRSFSTWPTTSARFSRRTTPASSRSRESTNALIAGLRGSTLLRRTEPVEQAREGRFVFDRSRGREHLDRHAPIREEGHNPFLFGKGHFHPDRFLAKDRDVVRHSAFFESLEEIGQLGERLAGSRRSLSLRLLEPYLFPDVLQTQPLRGQDVGGQAVRLP